MAGDDFLSRWSRRKREVAQERPPVPEAQAQAVEGEIPAHPEGEPRAEPPAVLGDDAGAPSIAELPPLDSLTAETDLAPFLKSGVPQFLRNAALRRMWSIDPSIRDYLSEAREYAFDWHIPGAVPGTGPMLPTDDIAGMVRDIFSGSRPVPDPSVLEEPRLEEAPTAGSGVEGSDTEAESPTGTDRVPDTAAAIAAVAVEPALPALPSPAAEATTSLLREKPGGRVRRHGGASPI